VQTKISPDGKSQFENIPMGSQKARNAAGNRISLGHALFNISAQNLTRRCTPLEWKSGLIGVLCWKH